MRLMTEYVQNYVNKLKLTNLTLLLNIAVVITLSVALLFKVKFEDEPKQLVTYLRFVQRFIQIR